MIDASPSTKRAGHAWRADLDWLESRGRARSADRVLDLGVGDGDTARVFARFTPAVIGADRHEPVLRAARAAMAGESAGRARVVAADLDALPFGDESFGAAICRGAAHRVPELLPVLRQVARVLMPRGMFLVADVLGPEDPELAQFIRELARRRDPSHVRAFRQIEWTAFLRAVGLTVIDEAVVTRLHDWEEWTRLGGLTLEACRDLDHFALAAPARFREALGLELDGDRIVSITERLLLLRADKD